MLFETVANALNS